MTRLELARAIAEAALLAGTFTLRSGRTSRYYIDKYRFSTRPDLLRQLGVLFAQRVEAIEADAGTRITRLAGAELGGIPLVTAASLESSLPCVFVRNQKKSYGTGNQIEGVIEEGDRVVILEDVATTGGQAFEAIKILRDAQAEVPAVIAVIDRQEGARERIESVGVRFDALFTRADLGIVE